MIGEFSTIPKAGLFPDDGLAMTTVEPWARQKINLVQQYLASFVAAIEDQVDEIIVVDLYARNGLCCLGTKDVIFPGIPIMALQQTLPIHKYVFCESDAAQFRDLKIRVSKYFKEKNTVLLEGKPGDLLEKIKMYVPSWRKDHRVAVFCTADAFSMEPDIDLVADLANYGFTFLIPFTFHLNAALDYRFYLQHGIGKIKQFSGNEGIEKVLGKTKGNNVQFYRHLVRGYEGMARTKGLQTATAFHKLDSGLMEIPTYAMLLLSARYPAKTIQAGVTAGNALQFNLFNQ